jgi:hypothetical protein
MPSGLALSDGSGTPNRGDINGEVQATGSVTYFGSMLHPPSSQVDIFVVCPDVSADPWPAANYDASSGTFSVSVYADNTVGADTYGVRIVNKGDVASGENLLGITQSARYIADAIRAKITPNREASTPTTAVFKLSLTYVYDGALATDYSTEIHRNGDFWQVVTSNSFSDVIDTENDYTYSVASTTENTHGLVTLFQPSAFTLSGDDAASIYKDASSNPPTVGIGEIYRLAETVIIGLGSVLPFIATAVDATVQQFYSLALYVVENALLGFALGFLILLGVVISFTSIRHRRARRKRGSRK